MNFFDYPLYWACALFLALPSSAIVPAVGLSFVLTFGLGWFMGSLGKTKL